MTKYILCHYFIKVQIVALLFVKAMGLKCYCENYCPELDTFNGTCEVSRNSYCFSAVELVYDTELNIYKEYRTYGCLSPDESGLMQCRGYLTKHARPKNITCCREYDSCNMKLYPQIIREEESIGMTRYPINMDLLIIIIVLGVFILLLGLITIVWFLCKKRIKKHLAFYKNASRHPICGDFLESKENSDIYDQSSGSGSGKSKLVQQTIGKQIQFLRSIGQGRYGEVLLAEWRGGLVAVKVFSTTDEVSWNREKEIYRADLRHENILGFIAADINGMTSYTQMILVTDYHELGSLYDYLKINSLDHSVMLRMGLSIIFGLSHLHTEIYGTKGKPAIAHRDIKSKNILVKANRECCIADFGLAVKYSSENQELDLGNNQKVGTRRYMAPEVLNGSINIRWFESLKCADIYSFSLVMWEICRRCVIPSGEKFLEAEEYQLPYYDSVPADPSIEEMREVVCDKEIRPEISKQWLDDPAMKVISQVLQECWNTNPKARLTALRIKKTLSNIQPIDSYTKMRLV